MDHNQADSAGTTRVFNPCKGRLIVPKSIYTQVDLLIVLGRTNLLDFSTYNYCLYMNKVSLLFLYSIYIAPTVYIVLYINRETIPLQYNKIQEDYEAQNSLQSNKVGQVVQKVVTVGNELMEVVKD